VASKKGVTSNTVSGFRGDEGGKGTGGEQKKKSRGNNLPPPGALGTMLEVGKPKKRSTLGKKKGEFGTKEGGGGKKEKVAVKGTGDVRRSREDPQNRPGLKSQAPRGRERNKKGNCRE